MTLVPSKLLLNNNEIHIWCAALNIDESEVNDLYSLLTDDEKQRAKRFKFAKDQQCFIAARSFLRSILSRYLSFPAQDIRFAYGEHGKPTVISDTINFHFNLAHSHEYALYAITSAGVIGIDIEKIRSDIAVDDIAKRFFSHAENEHLFTLEKELRTEAFFRCWTRKEAFIKAIGTGLSFSLASFDVSIENERAQILAIRHDKMNVKNWQLHHLEPITGYLGAVAVNTSNPLVIKNYFW